MWARSGIDTRLCQAQPLHRAAVLHMLLNDLRDILRLDKAIPDRLGVNDHRRPVLALIQAAGFVGTHGRFQTCGSDRLFEQSLQLAFSVGRAAPARAAGFPLIGADKQVSLESCQVFAPLFRVRERRRVFLCRTLRAAAPSARIGDEMMPPDNLHSLKDDMIAFIEGHGMKRLPGFVMEDVPSVLWEDEHNPDSWKDFVEMAKAAQAPFLTMSDITLEKEDLQSLLEDLRDFNFPDEMPDSEEVEELVNYVGKTGFVQLGFAHQGIMFLHETSTEWYDRYQALLESLESVGDIVIDEDADEE